MGRGLTNCQGLRRRPARRTGASPDGCRAAVSPTVLPVREDGVSVGSNLLTERLGKSQSLLAQLVSKGLEMNNERLDRVQIKILWYILETPGCTIEDVCNNFAPEPDDERREIAAATARLIHSGHAVRVDGCGGALYERRAAIDIFGGRM